MPINIQKELLVNEQLSPTKMARIAIEFCSLATSSKNPVCFHLVWLFFLKIIWPNTQASIIYLCMIMITHSALLILETFKLHI